MSCHATKIRAMNSACKHWETMIVWIYWKKMGLDLLMWDAKGRLASKIDMARALLDFEEDDDDEEELEGQDDWEIDVGDGGS